MVKVSIQIEDPRDPEVSELLAQHQSFCNSVTEACGVHALDVEKLRVPGVTLFGYREDGELLGLCALKLLGGNAAELKSMHTKAEARGTGVARKLLDHVIAYAKSGDIGTLMLETGSQDAFIPARKLYESFGFSYRDKFADYPALASSSFMQLNLDARDPKDVVEQFLLEVRSGSKPELAMKFMADSVTAHQVISEESLSIQRTPEEYAEHVMEMKTEYGDFTFAIDELIQEGSKVYARWTQHGNGITQVTSCVYRVDQGKIVEYWIQIDRLGLEIQRGAK